MSAASKARRKDPEREIVALEQGEWVSCGACGLPYYVEGKIQSLEDPVSATPEEFRRERNVDLRTGHEVVDVDFDSRTVTACHDGGRAAVIAFDSGATRLRRQGESRSAFDASDCP